MTTRLRWPRFLAAAAIVILAVGGDATAALADPAGPTDYRSEVISIEPRLSGFDISIIGGDSFVLLNAEPGVAVEVIGYRGEPYLRFGGDGVVERNERSPSRWLNEDRYAQTDLPSNADAAASPEWRVVASDGSYAWHDHRTHWMNTQRPPGMQPGDVVLEATVPIVVNGEPVAVAVRSVLLENASTAPALLGVAVALLGLGVLWYVARSSGIVAGLAAVAIAAGAIGAMAYLSVPPETGPPVREWALPVIAAAFAAAALLAERRGTDQLILAVLIGFSGIELGWWAWSRRAGLVRAIIPTSAPHWLDRSVTAATAATALLAVALAVATARRPRATGSTPITEP